MNKHLLVLTLCSLCPLPRLALADTTPPEISYQLTVSPEDDSFQVALRLVGTQSADGTLRFAAVAPGVYSRLDYGRLVRRLDAYDQYGDRLDVRRRGLNEWRVAQPELLTSVTYVIDDSFGADLEPPLPYIAGTSIEPDHALVTPVGVFGYLDDLRHLPVRLEVLAPEGWAVGTTLRLTKDGSSYGAASYDELADSPLLLGEISNASAHAGGLSIDVWAYASDRDTFDAQRVLRTIEPTVKAAADFIGAPPTDRYGFLFLFLDQAARARNGIRGMGALEYNRSSAFVLGDSERVFGILPEWSAHEIFHVVTPLGLHSDRLRPFDFSTPPSDPHAWLYEGVTVWASEMLQLRAGITTPDDVLSSLATKIVAGRSYRPDVSLAEASLGAYGSTVGDQFGNMDYRGALVGTLLDLKLLDESDGRRGLRELLLELLTEFGPNTPFPADGLFDRIERSTSEDVGRFLRDYVAGTGALPVAAGLDVIGAVYRDAPQEPTVVWASQPTARQQRLRTAWQAGTQPETGLQQLDFFLGQWDIEARSSDGQQIVGRARTDVRYILDGTAMQADYFGLDRGGNTIFRGTTLRTHDPQTGRFVVHWVMANLPGFTYIDEEYRDGELLGDGRGFDGQGEFVERYRYFDISETHYSFEMSRSYDGGATWQPYANLRATKRKPANPATI